MKKARIILAITALLAVVGGVFAAKAHYTPFVLWTYTTRTTFNGGIYYSITGPFCIVTNRFKTTIVNVPLAAALCTTGPATGTFTLSNTAGVTITLPEFECVPTITRTTLAL